jgi:hypothetical protein
MVLALPCVTESYKTYDDVHLVKTTDVGQVLLVGDPAPEEAVSSLNKDDEVRDGVTPPMRNVRERLFKKPIDVEATLVSKVEVDLLTILSVRGGWGRGTYVCNGWLVAPFLPKMGRMECTSWCRMHPSLMHPEEVPWCCMPVQGGTPANTKFVDYEEVWQVNPETGQGEWMPVTR